jgi:hypothetical protein
MGDTTTAVSNPTMPRILQAGPGMYSNDFGSGFNCFEGDISSPFLFYRLL